MRVSASPPGTRRRTRAERITRIMSAPITRADITIGRPVIIPGRPGIFRAWLHIDPVDQQSSWWATKWDEHIEHPALPLLEPCGELLARTHHGDDITCPVVRAIGSDRCPNHRVRVVA